MRFISNKRSLCPFECKKVKAVRKEIGKLKDKQHALQQHSDRLESLRQFSNEGFLILGLEQNHGIDCTVLMSQVPATQWDGGREVFLCRLPMNTHWNWICHLSLMYHGNCHAEIIDWSCSVPDMGYGSILMKHVINFLRASGIRYVTGSIASTDIKNEDKLRHFYTKFGFQITDHEKSRSLHLDLFDEQVFPLKHNDYLVCCRSDGYRQLRSDKIADGEL